MTELKLKDVKGLLPKKIHSVPGKGCRCCAQGEYECACAVDWTDYTNRNKLIDDLSTKNLLDYVEADSCPECCGFGKTIVKVEDCVEEYNTCPICDGSGHVIRVKEGEK